MNYIKSPFNYMGNKYNILPQILQYFPNNINTFVDLFCGGCDVSINVSANHKIANDKFTPIISILREFKKHDINYIIEYIDRVVKFHNLGKFNKSEYIEFRSKFNNFNYKNPLDLFILISHSFNEQFEFNKKGDFTCPSGYSRAYFNNNKRNNLILMHQKIQDIDFTNYDFRDLNIVNSLKNNDFVYLDPPYLITTATYNGKKGTGNWTEEDEISLYNLLDKLNSKGIKFGLSNIVSNNRTNYILENWMKKYRVIEINKSYKNCSYQKQYKGDTNEVLVINY